VPNPFPYQCQIWVNPTHGVLYHAKFHLDLDFTSILTKFCNSGLTITFPWDCTQSVFYHVTFILDWCILLPMRGKNPCTFDHILIVGAPVQSPWPNRVKFEIWHARVDPHFTLICKISSGSVQCVAIGAKTSKFGRTFNFSILWWRHPASQRQNSTRLHSRKLSPIHWHQEVSIFKRFNGEVVSIDSIYRSKAWRNKNKQKLIDRWDSKHEPFTTISQTYFKIL